MFFVLCFIKTQPFVKRKPVNTGKKIPERSRSVLGRFYCTYVSLTYELKKKLERYLPVNLLGPGPRLIKKEFTGPRSHNG